uniref:LRRCT domain-containing protein n=1 Tax=Branchiostoma floridae TaxID=7739 RepID=C3Y6K6_BRAFL|eukprot:XP_002607956.1 hypothetical protein BRAFLDRAFT_74905 [Branchiostoma floridae]
MHPFFRLSLKRCATPNPHPPPSPCSLFAIAACAASYSQTSPPCKTAAWLKCVPIRDKPEISLDERSGTRVCVVCEGLDNGLAYGSHLTFHARAELVAVRGYPFHVVSATTLKPLKHYEVNTLALVDAKITDVENNTFAGLSSLRQLSLDSNRLTHVKQGWFLGLENLLTLILSNNHIKKIDPGSFENLARLINLNLRSNLLHVVDPAWLNGLIFIKAIDLGLNKISIILPGSFKHLPLTWLDLRGNDLSSLNDVLWGESYPLRLHVGSDMLSSIRDGTPHRMTWSLHREDKMMRGSPATLVVEVPKFLFCVRLYQGPSRHNRATDEVLFRWMSGGNRSTSCGGLDRTISIQDPVVVLAIDGSLGDKLVPKTLDQCRQVWKYDGGVSVTVGSVESPLFRLVSLATGNATFEGVAMSFIEAEDTNTLSTTESECTHQKDSNHSNTTHDNTRNIPCILITKDEHMKLFFTIPQVQCQTQTTPTTTYRTDTNDSGSLSHYFEFTEKDIFTSSQMGDNYTLQASDTPEQDVPTTADHGLISVVVSVVLGLVVLSLVVLVWKVCSSWQSVEDGRASDDAHFWTIPLGVALPGLLRSASLPTCSRKMASDDVASCRSLPAVLHPIEPSYSEIPDDIAAAQRPLPRLPHEYWEIPDAVMVRSASLPVVRCILRDDAVSCISLPAFSTIPADHRAAAHRPPPVPTHTYGEIPDDDESGPVPIYADAADCSRHHLVTNRRENRRACRDSNTTSSRHLSGSFLVTYGLTEQARAQRSNVYRDPSEVVFMRAPRQLRTALVTQPADQGLGAYDNVTDAFLSLPLVTEPNTYVQCDILGERTHITGRPTSPPLVTEPNTYMPCEISREGTRITPRRASLPLVTLPNTYVECDILGERIRITPRRAPLPLVTLPNTYVQCGILGERTRITQRRMSLPLVTLPNTYEQSDFLGEGTCIIPQRTSLPLVTVPNTYVQCDIMGDRTCITQRRPLVTVPNTYLQCEISGEGTPITPRRASLPLVTLPNTYVQCDIPEDRTRRITPQRTSNSTLPNTYWPWDIQRQRTRVTGRRPSLPLLTVPNTYMPCEISGEGIRMTPTSTFTNTYWPWGIP